MDDGIDFSTIANISKEMKISLNASTISEKDLDILKEYGADFSHLEAWHNYYPRPETGLDLHEFTKRNRWLQEQGLKVIAFASGDKNLRKPICKGLPSLEKHRFLHPLGQMLELLYSNVDEVYIGDEGLQDSTLLQFQKLHIHQIISLRVTNSDSQYFKDILGNHQNRPDLSRDVIRSNFARENNTKIIEVEPTKSRLIGSITIDNKQYGRYMGEVQITKRNLPKDKKVNVVAQVIPDDICMLPYIKGSIWFELVEYTA